jgi:hypothetical protein
VEETMRAVEVLEGSLGDRGEEHTFAVIRVQIITPPGALPDQNNYTTRRLA